MSSPAENVRQFREVVTESIEQSLHGRIGRWPGMHNWATIGDLIFAQGDERNDRPSTFGFEKGRFWGIVKRNARVGEYAGSIAILSIEREDEVLKRKWDIASPLRQVPIHSQKIIESPEEVEMALAWALSPHLRGRNLEVLGRLAPEEEAHIVESRQELFEQARSLEADLAAIRRSQEAAWDNAHNIIIN